MQTGLQVGRSANSCSYSRFYITLLVLKQRNVMKDLKIVTKIRICSYNELDTEEKKLIDAAKSATGNAYAPYSGFNVGAAVLLEDGTIVAGNNQENVAYPSGLCAERTAIFYAQAQYPQTAPQSIAVAAYTNGKFTDAIVSPCGGCRQVLLEVENRYRRPIRILLYGENEVVIVPSARDLLPLAFSSPE